MKIDIAIATVGRPQILRKVVERLGRQSKPPGRIVVSAASEADVQDLRGSSDRLAIVFGGKGSSAQRNTALDAVSRDADVVLFLDDDFVPRDDYLAELERLFAPPDVVGVTGRLIADGAIGPGLTFETAVQLVDADRPPAAPVDKPAQALYGCNMAVRLAAVGTLRFDEGLPLYGWLEDIDFTYRLSRAGRLVRSQRVAGVHMGAKSGRTSGLRMGYSQIANPVYLLRRDGVPPKLAYRLMRQNLAANMLKSLAPEPWIDRRGRLRGNLLALLDIVRGQVDPRRVLTLE